MTISDNVIVHPEVDARATIDFESSVGIGVKGIGDVDTVMIRGNTVVNAPAIGIRVGRQTTDVRATRVHVKGNLIIDAGNAPASSARTGVAMYGALDNCHVSGNHMADTGTPTAKAANTVVMWTATGTGNSYTDNTVEAASAAPPIPHVIDTVVNTYQKRQTLDISSIPAHEVKGTSVTIPGARTRDLVLAQPEGGFEAGLMYRAHVTAPDTVTVIFQNVTDAAIDPVSRPWQLRVLRNHLP